MSAWVANLLKEAFQAEWGNGPIVAALATVDSSSNPHVRHVICRRIDEFGNIAIASDARSAKNQQIRSNRRVELSLWLAKQRWQFRIAGLASIDPSPEQSWRDLSDSTSATFFWPHPGQPLNPNELFPDAIGPAAGPPATFEVLIIRPDQVEHLDLNPHPHRRRRWRRQTNWELENLNP